MANLGGSGLSWTENSTGTSSSFYAGSSANGYFFACGSGIIAYSSNGSSWSTISSPGGHSSNIYGICYGGGKYIGAGYSSGRIVVGSGLSSWTEQSVSGQSYVWWTAYGNGKYVLFGEDGKISSSSDGSSWTTYTVGTG